MNQDKMEPVADLLAGVVRDAQVTAATIDVRCGQMRFAKSFGEAQNADAVFLLASITKPIVAAALMHLCERRLFDLNDPVRRFIPEFTADGRERITIRQLLTHTSGLPERLPGDDNLRARQADLSEFVEAAIQTSLLFRPGSQYCYSSPAFLLAAAVAERMTGEPIADLVDETVFQPLGMKHSALGLGRLDPKSLMRCQVEAAMQFRADDTATKQWDWNSAYWRSLGSPWSGAHGSAADVTRFLDAFLQPQVGFLRPETSRLMITNHNPPGIRSRGLGFDLGRTLGGPIGEATFGHGGVTGTLCWADPLSDSTFVVLTTLPLHAVTPHPRDLASRCVAEAIG